MKGRLISITSIVTGYFLGLIVLILGLGLKSDYNSNGYIVSPKANIIIFGDEAYILIYGLFIGSIILLIISIWYSIIYLKQKISKKAGVDSNKNYICIKCENPINGKYIEILICPKCGGDLELIKGFYDRHKNINSDG